MRLAVPKAACMGHGPYWWAARSSFRSMHEAIRAWPQRNNLLSNTVWHAGQRHRLVLVGVGLRAVSAKKIVMALSRRMDAFPSCTWVGRQTGLRRWYLDYEFISRLVGTVPTVATALAGVKAVKRSSTGRRCTEAARVGTSWHPVLVSPPTFQPVLHKVTCCTCLQLRNTAIAAC